jgi:putative ABC transport system permease protein
VRLFNLLLAIRNLRKNSKYTIINTLGLSVGLAAFILMTLFIHYHLSFDKHLRKLDRIYRVDQIIKGTSGTEVLPCSPFPLRSVIESKFPEIESATRVQFCGEFLSSDKEHTYVENNGLYVEPAFINIFDIDFIQGDPATALSDAESIVLSETLAQKYFGDENPVGKILKLMAGTPCRVTGVYKDLPQNRTSRPDYLVSYTTLYQTLQPDIESNWDWCMSNTYILLRDKADPNNLNRKINALLDQYTQNEIHTRLALWPYAVIHLHFSRNIDNRGMFFLLGIIAIFVLVIASINFTNLSTAYSSTRVKEIGVRKISGAFRWHIIRQFIGESLIISFLSLFIALFLAELMQPSLNTLMQVDLDLFSLQNTGFLLFVVLVTCLVGIISGSYPAFYLSSLEPGRALKGNIRISSGNPWLRKVLVVFQFIISVVLIVCTLIIYRQLNYMKNISLGFDKENILIGYLQLTGKNNMSRYRALKNDLLSDPRILSMSWSHNAPFFAAEWWRVSAEGKDPDERFRVQHNHIDFDFLKTFNIKLAEGRELSEEYPSDTSGACLISKETARILGWENNALGKTIMNDNLRYKVVGVMEDFHMFSVARPIDPQFFTYTTRQLSWPNSHAIKVARGQDITAVRKFVTSKFQEYFPDDNIEFNLLDENMDQNNFGFVIMIGTLFGIFSFLAIAIAAIGLFGLVSFVTKQRTKEIGIRKANGAMTMELFRLFSKEFVVLLIIANIIAIPVAYFACRFILEQFAYRIGIGVMYFVIAALFSVLITLLTISIQIFRASNANPVDSLRFE